MINIISAEKPYSLDIPEGRSEPDNPIGCTLLALGNGNIDLTSSLGMEFLNQAIKASGLDLSIADVWEYEGVIERGGNKGSKANSTFDSPASRRSGPAPK